MLLSSLPVQSRVVGPRQSARGDRRTRTIRSGGAKRASAGTSFLLISGKFAAQHCRETFGLGTFRLLGLGRRVDAGGSV